jgi:hypothetical protein
MPEQRAEGTPIEAEQWRNCSIRVCHAGGGAVIDPGYTSSALGCNARWWPLTASCGIVT